MGLISGFRVEWGWMSLVIAIATACLWRCRSCFSFSPSPPEASILLLKAWRRFRVGYVDCVVGFVSIPGCWIVWIMLLGCVDSGCVDLVAGFVFLVFCRWAVWIVLLGLFNSGLLDCVDCVARLCWFRVRRSCCWVCFSGFLLVGCVDSGVIPVWIVSVGRWLCG